jgi:hypothetical protein
VRKKKGETMEKNMTKNNACPSRKNKVMVASSIVLLLGLAVLPSATANETDKAETAADQMARLHNTAATYVLTKTDWGQTWSHDFLNPQAQKTLLDLIIGYFASTHEFTEQELAQEKTLAQERLAAMAPILLTNPPDASTWAQRVQTLMAQVRQDAQLSDEFSNAMTDFLSTAYNESPQAFDEQAQKVFNDRDRWAHTTGSDDWAYSIMVAKVAHASTRLWYGDGSSGAHPLLPNLSGSHDDDGWGSFFKKIVKGVVVGATDVLGTAVGTPAGGVVSSIIVACVVSSSRAPTQTDNPEAMNRLSDDSSADGSTGAPTNMKTPSNDVACSGPPLSPTTENPVGGFVEPISTSSFMGTTTLGTGMVVGILMLRRRSDKP